MDHHTSQQPIAAFQTTDNLFEPGLSRVGHAQHKVRVAGFFRKHWTKALKPNRPILCMLCDSGDVFGSVYQLGSSLKLFEALMMLTHEAPQNMTTCTRSFSGIRTKLVGHSSPLSCPVAGS